MADLKELIELYGTDKGVYVSTYAPLFEPLKTTIKSVLEIGIGTLDNTLPSNFAGNVGIFPNYKPGGSLRVWRDYFVNAKVTGVDIADDCMFSEDRIETLQFDSSRKDKCREVFANRTFDLIIDDGNHDPVYQIRTLENLLPYLADPGIYVIEDVGGYSGDEQLLVDFKDRFDRATTGYFVENRGNHILIMKGEFEVETREEQNYTIVSGLWDIGREGRGFEEHYLPRFEEFLQIPCNMVLFLPKDLHHFVWKRRNKSNTHIVAFELEDIKRLYAPHWDNTQKIRTNPEWYNLTGEHGWLISSPQARNEWYNPIVQSKMFMLHDASIWNPFDTDYFYWLDAGITNTVPTGMLTENRALDKLPEYTQPFLFLSYPYESAGEIHGFEVNELNRIAGEKVKYVCRGGLFGGHKDTLGEANALYYMLLQNTQEKGLMGTEESLFLLMAYREPEKYRRYQLDDNGLIVKFVEALLKNTVKLEEDGKRKTIPLVKKEKYKTNSYILTFNFPEQLRHTIRSMEKVKEWLERPHLVLLDNSTEELAKQENQVIAQEYGFEYVDLGGNTGICGGRQAAAEHFDQSDADFMFFFEDDMTINSSEEEGNFCGMGFRKYVPRLYETVHEIMKKEEFDFLKLSFSEVYWNNNIQTSWYNVPQNIRTLVWPEYDKLPSVGVDPRAPRTKFDRIDQVNGLSYITGEIFYANWPMIVSKEGNRKMFLDVKWDHPYEQTWMSHMFVLTKAGRLKPAVLLASPIWHDRIKHYAPEERREN